MDNELVPFTSTDGEIQLEVPVARETVWLTRAQLAMLFDRDVKTIGKHVNNALDEELAELSAREDGSVVAKFATTATDGKVYQTEHYSIDVIISVGYRVKSRRGIEFRRWANTVLKEHLLNSGSGRKEPLLLLDKVVNILKRASDSLDTQQVLSVIEQYTYALGMLDDYDHQRIAKPAGTEDSRIITYEECRTLIETMRFGAESSLFGQEKDDSFRGSIGAVFQSFNGKDVYPTIEEKAANLLYFIVKNHSFHDGNKRIAAAVFLLFLDRTDLLLENGKKRIPDRTLVALTIMIAESNPQEKELIIHLVMHFLNSPMENE
ncbi:MAG TPA: virulence protein RhuM/Fic/DOC family protein [Treponemataceae bacterium]|nr:virulence protein RhuM/Fic/DOC family protein [Treponemataceae bacterium]